MLNSFLRHRLVIVVIICFITEGCASILGIRHNAVESLSISYPLHDNIDFPIAIDIVFVYSEDAEAALSSSNSAQYFKQRSFLLFRHGTNIVVVS